MHPVSQFANNTLFTLAGSHWLTALPSLLHSFDNYRLISHMAIMHLFKMWLMSPRRLTGGRLI